MYIQSLMCMHGHGIYLRRTCLHITYCPVIVQDCSCNTVLVSRTVVDFRPVVLVKVSVEGGRTGLGSGAEERRIK